MTRLITMSALLLSTACLEVKTDDTSSEPSSEASVEPSSEASGEPSSDTGVEDPAMEAMINWDGESALLTLANANDDSIFYFGLTQTRGTYTSNEEAQAAQQWTAEDCHLGYGDFSYCHEVPASVDGYAYLELINTGNPDEITTSGDPQNTLFDGNDATDLTYILEDASNGLCYVWGDLPSYYDDFVYTCEYMPEWDM